MDKLIVRDIEFIGHCGITEEERTAGQRLSADIELAVDFKMASTTDRLQDSIDYVSVSRLIVSIGSGSKLNLLETLAEKMAGEILAKYNVSEILIRLRKCSVPVENIRGSFEVEIRRRQN